MNLNDLFWSTIAWIAKSFALSCVYFAGVTFVITVFVNVCKRRATHFDDLLRASSAASIPIAFLLIAWTIDPTKFDCASLLNITGIRVAIVIAGFGVLYIAAKAVFKPRS